MLEKINQAIKKAAGPATQDPQLISYQALRKAIGFIGMLLPPVLILGAMLFGDCRNVQPSISHYYYTNMREVFEGSLCAVALFLFCYKGYTRLDSWSANVAGFFALLIALFPTNMIEQSCQQAVCPFIRISFQNTVHLASACLYLLTLAFMSFFLFTQSKHAPEDRSLQKRRRNRIYRVCGLIILLSIACMAVYIESGGNEENVTILLLETIALLAFGFSWLTKGELFLKDKPAVDVA